MGKRYWMRLARYLLWGKLPVDVKSSGTVAFTKPSDSDRRLCGIYDNICFANHRINTYFFAMPIGMVYPNSGISVGAIDFVMGKL